MADIADTKPTDDLSALAWVHNELRRTLDNAHKALRRYLKESESGGKSDVDTLDPAALRMARTQLHQGVGALELVGLPAAARLLRASEAAVQRMVNRPVLVDDAAVHTIERASFALLDYIGRRLAGKPTSPVGLFPQYAAVQALAGSDRIHPADLWESDFQWHELAADDHVKPRPADEAARSTMEAIVLRLMRRPDALAWTRLSDLCAELAAGCPGGHLLTLWQLASGYAEGQAAGVLPTGDVHTKRVAARLLAQLRLAAKNQDEPSERLAQDLLFFCAHAKATDTATPRLDAVRHVWHLAAEPAPADYQSERLGRFDPSWIAQARKRVSGAKDAWSALAGGEQHLAGGLTEQFALLADSVDRLFPAGPQLSKSLQDTAAAVQASADTPDPSLAMEVATSVLYLDAILEDGELDQPELESRVRRLAQRINDLRDGGEPQPLEPWMEELYRRVSDRQTMGSVVHELRASLSEVEKQIDQYFRNPAERGVLIPVPGQLSAMRGVLSVLGMDQASQAVLQMRDDVDALASTEVDPQQAVRAGTFDHLADNLGALSFLIDMLSVQPQLAKSLFRFDPVEGRLSAVMGQSERASAFGGLDAASTSGAPLAEQARALADSVATQPEADHGAALEALTQRALAADLPGVADAASQAQRALQAAPDEEARQAVTAELAQTVGDLLQPLAPPPTPAPAPLPPPVDDLEDDAEMREIFLEEAREVIESARAALDGLKAVPDDVGELTTVRRAFHTLKGSSRMVGLRDYGDAAWACEQLYNARLAQLPRMDAELDAFTRESLDYLSAWTDGIADGRRNTHQAEPVVVAADSLRLKGVRVPVAAPVNPPVELPVLDLAADDLAAVADVVPAQLQAPAAHEMPVLDAALDAADASMALPELVLELPADAVPDFVMPGQAETAPAPGTDDLALNLPLRSGTETPDADELDTLDLTSGAPGPLDTLTARVPDLPAATDLDLMAPRAAGDEPDFEFDIGTGTVPLPGPLDVPPVQALMDLHGSGPADVDMPAADSVPTSEPVDPTAAAAEVDVVEIDFGDFESATEAAIPPTDLAPASADLVAETASEPAHESTSEPTPEPSSEPAGDELLLDLPGLAEPEPVADTQSVAAPEPPGFSADLALDLGSDVDKTQPLPGPIESLLRDDLPQAPATLDFDLSDSTPAAPPVHDLVLDLGALDAADVAGDAGFTEGLAQPEVAPLLPDQADSPDVPDALAADQVPADEHPADEHPADEHPADEHPAADAPALEAMDEAPTEGSDDEQVKVVGSLRIPIPLFNIYLNEADELSRRLSTELAEWGLEFERRPVAESTVVLAHSLAGSSATVGYADLSGLARALEHVLIRSAALGRGLPEEPALFNETADEIRRLLHQFAAGFLRPMVPGLMERLAEHERHLSERAAMQADDAAVAHPGLEEAFEAAAETHLAPLLPLGGAASFGALDAAPELPSAPVQARPARDLPLVDDEDIEAVDAIDEDLFPIFEEEAEELLPQLQARLHDWSRHPSDADAPAACMRTLHTFKGGARLAGAMRVGEMAHRLETLVEHLSAQAADAEQVEALVGRADAMVAAFEALRKPSAAPLAPAPAPAVPQPVPLDLSAVELDDASQALRPATTPDTTAAGISAAPAGSALVDAGDLTGSPHPAGVPASIDWGRFSQRLIDAAAPGSERPGASTGTAVRVRAALLDRLVNHAGEVSITRARINADVTQLQSAVNDLTDNLDRLRAQLRDIELQAEGQIASRIEAAKAASQAFDPLEMDRFTRFQELTRMMAESVNDVATVQRSVQRTLQSTEDELAAQARLTRELQDDLLRTRMVEFDSLADRLYRVVRQAAKDAGKQVRLDLLGGSIEVDRGVLDRMIGPFEHLLRNSVAHGIETADARQAAGKDATGAILITVTQEGNEIGVECRDDGAGLNLVRIRQRAEERGLLQPGQDATDAELANLIFLPGFSTAAEVTELAGRGVGLDVVRAEVNAMGGRIETGSSAGQGTRFKLVLPLTTAVTQVVLLRCGALQVAVPSTLIEVVRRVPTAQVEQAYASGAFAMGDQWLPFFWLGGLLQHSVRGSDIGRSQAVVIVRSAAQRVALHVDDVLGNQEVVVKHVGPQLARLPGLAGVTLLPSGAVALIYNPVALAALYGETAVRRAAAAQPQAPEARAAEAAPVAQAPLVLVVDDSLTVRRVTQRLLAREGYRVALAKDGMDALEKLAEERPAIMLSDIEMPRMDGFDLVRNVRADAALANLPVVMITSRIAQKHRDYAAELGVDHYLGKPYAEDELLKLVARYAGAAVAA